MSITVTTTIEPPPGPSAKLQLPTPGQGTTNPAVFEDAMVVRMRVFVDEQRCSADAEIDDDDNRSWHWVLSASRPSSTPEPVGVIRLVPPPQPPHEALTHPDEAANLPAYDWAHEPCIKLTRVAVLAEYRGRGLARQLVQTALDWAASHAKEIDEAARLLAGRCCDAEETPAPWKGLVLVHAQVDVEKMYAGLGFVTDESLGRWDEEGIEHVGMFRRLVVAP
ncbi:uncharacterized protein PFLUO_LOCUS1303 [Penicillium psychrofluorescens]|uniref:uncharacterized protein n=1 Tax=Penicillium psychrofluorescens TaxID=3158075 RepID=UPI003CCE33EB